MVGCTRRRGLPGTRAGIPARAPRRCRKSLPRSPAGQRKPSPARIGSRRAPMLMQIASASTIAIVELPP